MESEDQPKKKVKQSMKEKLAKLKEAANKKIEEKKAQQKLKKEKKAGNDE